MVSCGIQVAAVEGRMTTSWPKGLVPYLAWRLEEDQGLLWSQITAVEKKDDL